MDSTLIWVLLAVLVVLVLVAIWAFVTNQKKARQRVEASHLRERAAGSELEAEDRETAARHLQEEASEAKERAARAEEEAQRLDAEARQATREAREQRDHVTNDYLEADEIDPDTKPKR